MPVILEEAQRWNQDSKQDGRTPEPSFTDSMLHDGQAHWPAPPHTRWMLRGQLSALFERWFSHA